MNLGSIPFSFGLLANESIGGFLLWYVVGLCFADARFGVLIGIYLQYVVLDDCLVVLVFVVLMVGLRFAIFCSFL